MNPGRIAVVALVLAVIGGALALDASLGDDDRPHGVGPVMLDDARQEDPVALQEVAEDDDGSGGPDPTGDGMVVDGTGADRTADLVATTGGSTLDDALRRELVRERAEAGALRRQLSRARAGSDKLRRQLAAERRQDSDDRARASRWSPSPAPAPAPARGWGGGDSSSGGGSDT